MLFLSVEGSFMNYINQCTDEQIKDLMRCYAKNYTDISIDRMNDCIKIELINDDLPELYIVDDYNVEVFDWNPDGTNCFHDFKKKMLEYFGNQYAIDYLLDCV